jgi:glutamate carboxypeptidase
MQTITDSLIGSAERHLESYLADLKLMTSIDCPTHHKPGLDQIAEIIAERLHRFGANVTIGENADAGNDVVGVVRGRGAKRVVLLCHTDTVYPVGTVAQRPFRIEGDKALAPGVCDEKGGLLAAVYSLQILRDVGFDDFRELTVLCNSDEEAAPRHSVELIQKAARQSDAVLTMEPARINGDVVSARKGVLVYVLTAHGREAHAGVNPDLGRSAILGLADRIVAIWALNGALPGLNVNPGLIRGGSAVNTVAGQASVEIDVRIQSAVDIDEFDAMLRRTVAECLIPDIRFDISRDHTMPPMEKTAASTRIVDLAKVAAHEIGFELNDTFTGGGSDGAHAAAVGTPVLDGLGPIGGYAHSEDEFLDITSVVPRLALLARLVTLL